MPHCSLHATVVLLLVILKEQPSSSAPLNGKVSACLKKKNEFCALSLTRAEGFLPGSSKVKSLLSERGSCCVPSTFSRKDASFGIL